MLELYMKEFIGVSMYLMQKNPESVKNEAILIEKEQLRSLLDKNKYDTADNKLKIWKKLRWIDTDKDRRMTKRVYVRETRSYARYISINKLVLETLQELTKK